MAADRYRCCAGSERPLIFGIAMTTMPNLRAATMPARPEASGGRTGSVTRIDVSSNRIKYEARMHRVLRHIDANLAAPLELAELARVANFSTFHFHRLFAAWMGERLGDYVRRRRLEVAATRLATQPESTVLAVALTVGFNSAEAFSRSFKDHFGEAPTSWRLRQGSRRSNNSKFGQGDGNPDHASSTRGREHVKHRNPSLNHAMDVQIKSLQPVEIAYLRHVGPHGPRIARFWLEQVLPWIQTNGLMHAGRYGISHDDPSVADPRKCRYDACVEASNDLVLSGQAQRATLPGGRYAVLKFTGGPDEISDAWTRLLRDWLPSSGLQLDDRPCFEYYPPEASDRQEPGTFTCDICIPVAKP
jgi:AraC family transcriptional regulator